MKIVQIIHESCGYVYLCAADGKASWKVVCVYLSLSIPMMQNHSRFYFLFFAIKKIGPHCHVIANYSNFDIYLNLLRLWLLKKKALTVVTYVCENSCMA